MKRQLTALSLLLAFVTVFVLAPVTTATAQTASGFPVTAGTSTGGTFTGTMDIKKFKANGPNLVLDGTLSGTIRNADGTVVPVNKESVNNVVVEGANTPTSGTVQAVACSILNLELGPLDLNLLGLVVHLDQVVLTITAVSGAGNLLGNLLCAIAGLLDPSAGIPANLLADLLNAVLAILDSLQP